MSTPSPSPGDPIHLVTDDTRCVGAGQCVRTDPTVFDQSEWGTVTLLRDTVPADAEETIALAMSLCPGQAISRR